VRYREPEKRRRALERQPQARAGSPLQRFKDWGEFVFALVLTIYGVLGYYAVREQLDLTWRQIAIAQDQIVGGDRAERRTRQDIAQSAANEQALIDANRDLATAAASSAKSAQRSANQGALQLERTDRPDLVVGASAAGPATATAVGMEFKIRIAVTNVGRSSASAAQVISEITYDNRRLVSTEIDGSCVSATKLLAADVSASTIRPSETQSFNFEELVHADDIRAHALNPGGAQLAFAPVIVGCVAYRIPYSTSVHRTPFKFTIYRNPRMPSAPNARAIFALGASVPSEEIFLVQNALSQHPPD